ncbi:caspase family protein [Geothrix campi]|uniref:caspase family protein n=1 Tax=Geothrix campi TaxID=2966450 RepID=UPI002148EF5E|nr:caspase family protein [Geothrix sp. SG10]
MLHRTALCVGINQYQNFPSANLNGCVNDAHDMAALLKDLLGFEDSDIIQLTDQAATKANIMRELRRMVEGALASRYNHLVFTYAGHGTQVPDLNLDEFDRADEAFCPHDLAKSGPQWDRDHLIVDDELHDLFVQLPQTVILEILLDTSHSGAGLRAADLLMDRKPRYLPPPSVEAFRDIEYRRARPGHIKLLEKGLSHHILWTACKESQTAADAFMQGDWHGAFTWHFCREAMASGNHLTRAKVLAKIRSDLSAAHFTQTPQLDCEAVTRHAVMKAVEVPPNVTPLPTEMPT